jgi:hypothetical protein
VLASENFTFTTQECPLLLGQNNSTACAAVPESAYGASRGCMGLRLRALRPKARPSNRLLRLKRTEHNQRGNGLGGWHEQPDATGWL